MPPQNMKIVRNDPHEPYCIVEWLHITDPSEVRRRMDEIGKDEVERRLSAVFSDTIGNQEGIKPALKLNPFSFFPIGKSICL